MSLPKITKLRLLLLVMTEFMVIRSTSSCEGKRFIQIGVSDQDKQIITDIHNKMRQEIALGQIGNQPPATNMNKLTWSDQLAQKAQEWATGCSSYIHDPQRHLGNYLVGQNIARKWTTRAPRFYHDMQADWISDAISKWFNEYAMYTYNRHYGSSRTGHYTQLIWADTNTIGCGFAYYIDPRNRYTKKYVCNYGPSGNVDGEPPYEEGYPNCFARGQTQSTQYQGLCEGSAKQHGNYNNFNYGNNNGYFLGFNEFLG